MMCKVVKEEEKKKLHIVNIIQQSFVVHTRIDKKILHSYNTR